MKKEEILKKAQAENKNRDYASIEVSNKAATFAGITMIILAAIYFSYEILMGKGTNYALYSLLAIYNTVLYPKGDTTNWYKPQMIEGTTVNGQQNVRLAVIYFGVTNGFIPFDVSIKEPYIYEGTYINPPFFESLDVMTQGWAMRRDMTNMNRAWYKKVLSLSAGTHWVGIVGHVFGSKFLLSIGESDDDLITTNNSEASTHEIYEVTSNYALFNSTKNYRNSLLKVESISVLESTVANNIVQSFSYRTTTSKSVITAVQVKTTKKYLVMSILPLWSEYGNPWQTGLIYNFFGTNQDSSTSVVSANAGQTVVPSYTNLVIKP